MEEIILSTPCGEIKGERRAGADIFRGIRYARTPSFEKPVEISSWDGVYDATKNAPDCWQYGAFIDESKEPDNFYYKEFRSDGAERSYTGDFVTLNIVSPRGAADAPVLAFIHGGGHETGTVGELPYGESTAFAEHGIVYVSIGYRLNVFSLYRNMNLGLHDLVCALNWLRRNIASFGGDPARVTCMGQSAGAMSLSDLCCSDVCRGLIKGAVLMSGGGAVQGLIGPMTKEEFAPMWDKMDAALGVRSLDDLRAVPPEKLWRAWYAVHGSREVFGGSAVKALRSLHPGIDGEIIRESPQLVIKRGGQLDIPYIFGVTSQDMMPLIIYRMARQWAKSQREHGMAPVYAYFFDRTPPGGPYKAFHAADLWYVLGEMEKSRRHFEEADYALHREMAAYIAAFVKTGSPNAEGLSEWLPLSAEQRGFRRFDGARSGYAYPAECAARLLRTTLFDKGPL